jgi:Cof subfamily protein (haloacid dehalogenase superfamily)
VSPGPPAGPTPPRLVATDLDGTLVRTDGSISGRTVEVVERLESAGVVFVMVTGRPPRWMSVVADEIGHHGLAVCANGALLYDLHTERVIRAHLLDADAALDVVQALRRDIPGIAFAVEKGPLDGLPGAFAREPVYVPRWDNGEVAVEEVQQMLAGGAVKLLARSEAHGSDELLTAARATLGDIAAELTHSSDGGLLEISAAGISKASGLAALAAERGIDAAEVIAFGDMPNDLPMLAWAGHSVGMANAHPDVLAEVDEVTASNDEDGVARVLERWF